MEATLLFFLIGLAVFTVKRITVHQSTAMRLACFVVVGALAGGLVGWLAGHPMNPAVLYPPWLVVFSGAFVGLLCFWAEVKTLLMRPGLQYVMTLLLGVLTAAFTWGVAWLYRLLVPVEVHMVLRSDQEAIIWIAVGFVAIFGYTFPERYFKPSTLKGD